MPLKIEKTDAQWKAALEAKAAEPLAFEVSRHAVTERPFTGALLNNKEKGQYHCVCCDKTLFTSEAKYDSGCGWPSFFAPADAAAVATQADNSLFMRRTEILCPDCGAHLGHVFEDGPTPTGLRYCTNSAALSFKPE